MTTPLAPLWAGWEWSGGTRLLSGPMGASVPGVPFLTDELGEDAGLVVEVAFGANPAGDPAAWPWTDVTEDVRAGAGLSWKLGRQDESSRSNPATLSLQLDNTAGDYSLGGTARHWPNVRRGTPVRVRINPGDGQGWRTAFLGSADGWTPAWDSVRGDVAVVDLSASGTLRRLSQGASPVLSALRRAMTSTSSVKGYWPMEDGKRATVLTPAVGTAQMTYTGTVDLAADSDTFLCSAALPSTRGCSFDALVDSYTSSTGGHQARWLMSFPTSDLTDGTVLARIYTSGTIAVWVLQYRTTGGSLQLIAYNADGTLNFTSSVYLFAVNGQALRMSVELVQDGADADWLIGTTSATATSALYATGTATGRTIGRITRVTLLPDATASDLVVGHLAVQNQQTSLYEANGPLLAYDGEGVTGSRLSRLCTENSVGLTLYGGTPDLLGTRTDQVGPQTVSTLVSLLQECEDVEQGQLWDGLTAGLAYTTRRRHENADPTITIDAGAGELAPPFEAVDDDQRTRNKVTVSRTGGSDATFEDVDGDLGTDAIGIYDDSVTVNAYSDGTLLDLASWHVHRGTVPGYRYPSVTVNLRVTPRLAGAVLDLIPGARIDVVNLDDALTGIESATVRLTVEGLQHKVTPREWVVTATCSPYSPWEIAMAAQDAGDTTEEVFRLGGDSSSLTDAVDAGATSFQVSTSSGPLWSTTADDYPLDLDIGGVQVAVTGCSGASSPQTFTCAALPRAFPGGVRVQLYDPPALGL